jgi:nucleoside-diphosphate-sugar epimerase
MYIVGETINLGNERSLSIRDLVNLIAEILCRIVSIIVDSSRIRPNDAEFLTCDYTKASRLLGWSPTVSLREGLRITVAWANGAWNSIKYAIQRLACSI